MDLDVEILDERAGGDELRRLAVLSARTDDRALFAAVLALDHRLGGLVASAHEPMLGQVRLSWWREQFCRGTEAIPASDPLMSELTRLLGERTAGLVDLVNGWEVLLSREVDNQALIQFARGRASIFPLIGSRLDARDSAAELVAAGELWALVDFACHCRRAEEGAAARALARRLRRVAPSRPMRPLAVLAGLAGRALDRDMNQILGDRLSPFAALRISLIGR